MTTKKRTGSKKQKAEAIAVEALCTRHGYAFVDFRKPAERYPFTYNAKTGVGFTMRMVKLAVPKGSALAKMLDDQIAAFEKQKADRSAKRRAEYRRPSRAKRSSLSPAEKQIRDMKGRR
jgi:hypothetical protein